MSLRARIIVAYGALVAAALFFAMHLIMSDIRPRYLEAVEEAAVDTAELLAALLAGSAGENGLETEALAGAMRALADRRFAAPIYNVVKRDVRLRVYVTDAQGALLYDSSGEAAPGTDYSRWNDVHRTLRGKYGARSTRSVESDPTTSVMYVAAPIIKNGERIGVVSVGKPQDSVSVFIDMARRKLRLTLVLIGLSAMALAITLSFWISRPIKRLTAYVSGVREGKNPPLPRLGIPEVAALGAAIRDMQHELEGKSYIEDYVRALTHEMKSPLTGIAGAAEILREQVRDSAGTRFLDNIETETGRMQSLINRMLQLSRLENARSVAKKHVAASPFLHGLAEAFHPRLTARGLCLTLDAPGGLVLFGDELLLHQAVGNLVANAADFAPEGSRIDITVREEPGFAVIAVSDQGGGMPDFALNKAFDKFFSLARPDTGQKSTGLGLPFVREVAALHGGSVRLANTETGLTASIRLPAS